MHRWGLGAVLLAVTGVGAQVPPGDDWLSRATSGIEAAEYHFAAAEPGRVSAPNRVHGFRTEVHGGGVRVTSRTLGSDPGRGGWTLVLEATAWGRPASLESLGAGQLSVDRGRADLDRGALVERWVNDPRGLELLVDVPVPPPGPREAGPLVLSFALEGDLVPALAEDGGAVLFRGPGAKPVVHLGALVVTDAAGALVPSRMAFEGRELQIRVDDDAAVYPLHVDPLLTSPSWTDEPDQAEASFGYSVATAGDLNGDGFSDVVVGAYRFDGGQADEGAAFVYLGSPSGPPSAASFTLQENQASARYGFAVSTAGDLDGDGFDDLLVGAPYWDTASADSGRVFIYAGSSPFDTVSDRFVGSSQLNAHFGDRLAPAGDVDTDFRDDVLIGATDYDAGQADEGGVFLYYGNVNDLIDNFRDWSFFSDQASARLGAVGPAGDVNGDGYDDVIVGAYLYDGGAIDEGKAWVFHGGPGGLAATAAWTDESDQAEAQFGIAVHTAGDTNGDGYADVVVGANAWDNGLSNEGAIFVYRGSGSGLATAPAHRREGESVGAQLGYATGTAGDVNGDGFADVVAGALQFDGAGTSRGRLFLWEGSASGLPSAASWTVDGDQDSARLGRSVGTAGDVNGDGYSDVIAGADGYDNGQANEGRAFLFLGSGDGLTTTSLDDLALAGATVGTDYGYSVHFSGDVNGDGFSDVVVGAPGYDGGQADEGGAFVYHGSAAGLPATANATLQVNQANALFGFSVSGAGDVNGDGFDDVVVGAPEWNVNTGQAVRTGRLFAFHGGPSGVDATADFGDSHYGTASPPDANFGDTVSAAGDVNGDGFGDVAVGATGTDEAFVYYGSSTGLGAANEATLYPGLSPRGAFGADVAGAGDVNRDGFADVIVGNPSLTTGDETCLFCGSASGIGAGPCAFLNGAFGQTGTHVAGIGDVNGDGFADVASVDGGSTLLVYHGSASGPVVPAARQIGVGQVTDVSPAGDVNGDGFADLLVGRGLADRADVWLGSSTGIGATAAWTVFATTSGDLFGYSADGAGDVNGDGFSDVIVGAYSEGSGAAHVYYGGGGDGLDRRPRQLRTATTAPVALLGSSDASDAVRFRLFRRSPAGRDSVGLQWQFALPGQAFGSGVNGQTTLADTGAPGAGGSATDVERLVTGLSPESRYRWRVRHLGANPLFPRSQWFAVPGNTVTETDLRTGCAASTWYRDQDGDTFGNAAVTQSACAQPTGYVASSTDCNDADATMFPGNPEVCDGKDNDCDGTPDDGFAPPGGFTSVTASKSGATIDLAWPAVAGADRYDTVRGRIEKLRGTGGSYADTVEACVGNDTGPAVSEAANPPVGDAYWYLVRAVNCTAAGTYDEGVPSQAGTRDAEIAASGAACP